ncbi:WXG100 family type VII secretion target [Clostridium sp. MCC353]|uniref:WXG100 family type VII secretion target n=1 Tax=Clostridium sp. MCC353 TaxID=2592646 RepID=UPI001C01B702|nr:WXG100 family type VII secretion target [Clostridium sp. MCC353]MBT9778508.1 WXG100 family type VII secretion target [Clostridium sp. MCC353]
MEGILKVTPEKLTEGAANFGNSGRTVSSLTSEMMSTVKNLSTVWEGEASAAYVNKFTQLQDDIERMNRMIQEHVTDLNDMARTYQDAENANTQESGGLLGDVIQ